MENSPILLITRDTLLFTLTKAVLCRDVDIAQTPEQALQAALGRQHRYAAVLIDLYTAKGWAWDLLHALCERPGIPPIVVLTANTSYTMRQAIRRTCAARLLYKPFDATALRRLVLTVAEAA